jgi:hypothetical protein
MSMIARDAALLVHEHHHGGSAIPASQIDGKISTAGSYRAMYRQHPSRRAHTSPFFRASSCRISAASVQTKINCGLKSAFADSVDDGVG